jgi:hypothetical protein
LLGGVEHRIDIDVSPKNGSELSSDEIVERSTTTVGISARIIEIVSVPGSREADWMLVIVVWVSFIIYRDVWGEEYNVRLSIVVKEMSAPVLVFGSCCIAQILEAIHVVWCWPARIRTDQRNDSVGLEPISLL